MNSYIAMFEIPATDLARAVTFYQAVLGVDIECMEMPDMEMGILPYEGQLVPAVIVKGEGYIPSSDGVTVYLNAGDDLQPMLDRVAGSGGQVILEKTAHADNSGFFALFLDSEGNKLALNSAN
ncbi:MAG: glyoxalase [Oceanospirillaceae bacterium]|jgi:predicted enzyme related to lactoylglutathione lyase|nr:glyoxalase [Oceanospirillaceae bacterium]|tara:strand:- start:263 stop:631 length:369 start_codon:yes stop_codon:yes gene_type:complete